METTNGILSYRALLILLLISVSALLAVSAAYMAWAPEAATDKTPPLDEVTVAVLPVPNDGLFFVAYAKNFFAEEGLAVTVRWFESGQEVIQALYKDKAAFAFSGNSPILHAVAQGREVRIVSTVFDSYNVLLVVARKDRGIMSPKDLSGKRIGVTLGSNGEFVLDTFLLYHDVASERVELINIAPNRMVDALADGAVDAIVSWEPYTIFAEQKLRENALVFGTKDIHRSFFQLVADAEYIRSHADTVERFVRALARAEQFIRENPKEAWEIVSDMSKIDNAFLAERYARYTFSLNLSQPMLIDLERHARWLTKKTGASPPQLNSVFGLIHWEALERVRPDAVTLIH
ncbi:MAG: ABC transporter substrate-binding protein [Parcubacteria group bacterium]|nr:ABC transporter substrate-binding protein [Parcubacteria group bacterium]